MHNRHNGEYCIASEQQIETFDESFIQNEYWRIKQNRNERKTTYSDHNVNCIENTFPNFCCRDVKIALKFKSNGIYHNNNIVLGRFKAALHFHSNRLCWCWLVLIGANGLSILIFISPYFNLTDTFECFSNKHRTMPWTT